MNSSEPIRNKANRMMRRAWVCMGMPFDAEMVNEKKEGIIDIEALLITTFLLMGQDRIVTDLPAWIIRFKDIINHQKLKTMLKGSPEKYRKAVVQKLNQDFFGATSSSFKKIFGVQRAPTREISETIEMRARKLNSLENVSQSAIMVNNRLLYGTGFRADLMTITQIKNLKLNGREIARLLYAYDSTISRILNDLRACGFLDQDNERVKNANPYPGMFISSDTVRNLYEILDAAEFRSEELKKTTYENLNFKYDKFGMQLVTGRASGKMA
jgi:hypothetical protein